MNDKNETEKKSIHRQKTAENQLVEVRFNTLRKELFLNPKGLELQRREWVTVEQEKGYDIGEVSLVGENFSSKYSAKELANVSFKVLHQSNNRELKQQEERKGNEQLMLKDTRKIVKRLGLSMKICSVALRADRRKATFYYTAEERIDFRQLIKDLASAFRIRIEMKQIGVRQAAALIGGIGDCGRTMCCSSWKFEFTSIPMNSLSKKERFVKPEKIIGHCGKVKCCMAFG